MIEGNDAPKLLRPEDKPVDQLKKAAGYFEQQVVTGPSLKNPEAAGIIVDHRLNKSNSQESPRLTPEERWNKDLQATLEAEQKDPEFLANNQTWRNPKAPENKRTLSVSEEIEMAAKAREDATKAWQQAAQPFIDADKARPSLVPENKKQ